MDNDEDIRLQLHSSNTNSRTNCHPICTLYNAIVMILVLVVLVCGIAFGFIVVERGRNVERRVILLEFQLKKVKRLLAEKKVLTKNNSSTPDTEIGKIRARQYGGSFAYISKKLMCQKIKMLHRIKFNFDEASQKDASDRPIGHWKVKSRSGNISLYSSTYLKIMTPGLYQVYAQAYFFGNTNTTKSMDLLIKRNHNTVAKCLVPVTTCREGCTRYLSRMLKLQNSDYLSIQSSSGVRFMISETMAFFGAVLLME